MCDAFLFSITYKTVIFTPAWEVQRQEAVTDVVPTWYKAGEGLFEE